MPKDGVTSVYDRRFGREMRVALCKRCNFDCFFCHSEGLDRDGKDTPSPAADVLDLVHRAMALRFSDITFTGGEPLLRHRELSWILDQLAREASPPDITVVTNASVVSDAFVASARAYPGRLKLNVSLHSTDPDAFHRITRSTVPVERVLANIRRLTEAGLRVKLNTVVLNGLNSGQAAFRAHLDAARSLGVAAVKFLELLVTPANREHYGFFYSDEAIGRDLAPLGFSTQSSNLRTQVLTSTALPDLVVEITRCTCKLGCAHCAELRDRQFDSDLLFHPCFVLSHEGLDPGAGTESLEAALRRGDGRIAAYARIYGNDSPMLVPHETYVDATEEVFFETPLSPASCEDRLVACGIQPVKSRSYHLFYCLPQVPDADWLECRRVIKYGYDDHTPNRFEIIFTGEEHRLANGRLVSRRTYMTPRPVEIPAQVPQQADALMRAFGYVPWFARAFRVVDFSCEGSEATISVDTAGPQVNLKVTPTALQNPQVQEALRMVEATPILIPFTAWLAQAADTQPSPVL